MQNGNCMRRIILHLVTKYPGCRSLPSYNLGCITLCIRMCFRLVCTSFVFLIVSYLTRLLFLCTDYKYEFIYSYVRIVGHIVPYFSLDANSANIMFRKYRFVIVQVLKKGFPTCDPRAACSPRSNFMRPAKSQNPISPMLFVEYMK